MASGLGFEVRIRPHSCGLTVLMRDKLHTAEECDAFLIASFDQ